MTKGPKQGKNAEKKRMDNQEKAKSRPLSMGGRDILRREAQFRIAPKHPGMGRR